MFNLVAATFNYYTFWLFSEITRGFSVSLNDFNLNLNDVVLGFVEFQGFKQGGIGSAFWTEKLWRSQPPEGEWDINLWNVLPFSYQISSRKKYLLTLNEHLYILNTQSVYTSCLHFRSISNAIRPVTDNNINKARKNATRIPVSQFYYRTTHEFHNFSRTNILLISLVYGVFICYLYLFLPVLRREI